MEKLEGFKIETLGFVAKRMGDLLYHEGPLLSHFINENNPYEHYFYKWSDCDDTCNRWLVFRVATNNLKAFFKGKLNLLELIKQNPLVYFMDLDNDIETKQVVVCPKGAIPEDYLPSENSFFKEKKYEKYALILRDTLFEKPQSNVEINTLLEVLIKEVVGIKTKQVEANNVLNLLSSRLNIPPVLPQ